MLISVQNFHFGKQTKLAGQNIVGVRVQLGKQLIKVTASACTQILSVFMIWDWRNVYA